MMRYDKSGIGWGRGDALYACDAKRGNCTDFHALLMAWPGRRASRPGSPSDFRSRSLVGRVRSPATTAGLSCMWADVAGFPLTAARRQRTLRSESTILGIMMRTDWNSARAGI